jgi:BON domain
MQRFHYLTFLPLGLVLVIGCKQNKMIPPPNDQQIAGDIQAKLASDQNLQGQAITPAFSNGVATLTGTSTDENAREFAGEDAGSVKGVRTVVNDLTVPSEQVAVCTPSRSVRPVRVHARRKVLRTAPIERAYVQSPPPAPVRPMYAYVAPPPPVILIRPRPIFYPGPILYPRPIYYRRYWR